MSSNKLWNKYIILPSWFSDLLHWVLGSGCLLVSREFFFFLHLYEICDFWWVSRAPRIWLFRDVHILLSGWNGPLWNTAYAFFFFCALFLLALAQCYFGDEYYYFLSQLVPFSIAASRVMFISITLYSDFSHLPFIIL